MGIIYYAHDLLITLSKRTHEAGREDWWGIKWEVVVDATTYIL